MNTARCARRLTIGLGLAAVVLCRAASAAGDSGVAYLAAEASADALESESAAALELARQIASATLVMPAGGGRFVDAGGREVALERFRVVWHHQGDSNTLAGPLYEAGSLDALKAYLGEGRSLFLSGAALALVHSSGIETARPRLGRGGRDQYVAQLIPAARHPIFAGLEKRGVDLDESVGGNPRVCAVPITSGGYPAYADFLGSGGPHRGMLLARAAAGDENPLVEYEVAGGRLIVLGWRLAHYGLAPNAHRRNLERLTANVLGYLGDPRQWQPVVLSETAATSQAETGVAKPKWQSLEMAIRDLTDTFGERYPNGRRYLERLRALRRACDARELTPEAAVERFDDLQREALLSNPLVDFDRLLLVERSPKRLGLPANWQSNSSLPTTGYDNRLAVLSPVDPEGELTTLYRPDDGRFVGDVDLDFDARRLLFSMAGSHGRWQVFEMNVDGSGLRELPLINEPDVDNYDACYLPDGQVAFTSTAPFVGVPCVYGNSHVTNLYRWDRGGSIRQLTVDQEHNWCPTVAHNGRIIYLRWEYTDLPHSNSRILFHMNPDGTGQMEYYGSNSFFVNSFFYARPVPGHPTKVVGVATGHHGVARAGRLLVVDPALGRHEADGVVREIPGWNRRVEPIILDPLVDGVWPQFLHPYPLSDKYVLVSARPAPDALWGIYLVDAFDNMTLIKQVDGHALLEPVPLRPTSRPPVIQDRVDPERRDAVVYMTDVHVGDGLKGVPRGTVKKLRLFTYQFSYRGMGGLLGAIGMDGPWDVKKVLGTVPVEPDGSAKFRVPAYTPIAVQPLDEDGQALQLMRSWFTAMPGEVLSCVGCHEKQNTVTPNRPTIAARQPAAEITPWHGPTRGFAFAREVQPVLDRYCVGCHDGGAGDAGPAPIDLRGGEIIDDWKSNIAGHVSPAVGGKFSRSYVELHRFVRRPGIESDIRLLTPLEFHAGTTELIQMLRKGHHNVALDAEAWDRLITWIDLNAPYHGTWSEIVGRDQVEPLAARARAMRKRYTGMDEEPEVILPSSAEPIEPILPEPLPEAPPEPPACEGWPFDVGEARRRQAEAGPFEDEVDLGDGMKLALVRIPAGRFVMGDAHGHADERPPSVVAIDRPFWMGRCEVTNRQFARFDPGHDSRVEPMHGYQFGIRGYPVNRPDQPVVRVSWDDATAFCDWLSERTGRRFRLPTEAQWEYACRAGTATAMWYGDLDADFSRRANLGDAKLQEFALDTYIQVRLIDNPNPYDDWVPKDDRFNDGGFVSTEVGRYAPNPWGLHDVHGNVWEWTRSALRPYPYDAHDGRNEPGAPGPRVVRGGSWYDRPMRCRSSFRLAYPPYQRVFNVGFRVVIEGE